MNVEAPVYWVIPGKLAGMPFPFLHPDRRIIGGKPLEAADDDLPLLHQAGIRGVVSLVNNPSDAGPFRDAGFDFLCLPVPDGRPPTPEQVDEFVGFADRCHQAGQAVVVHCHAGLGRTGTMLAAFLIRKGASAAQAIDRVRAAEPAAIETRRQLEFLGELAIRSRQGTDAAGELG